MDADDQRIKEKDKPNIGTFLRNGSEKKISSTQQGEDQGVTSGRTGAPDNKEIDDMVDWELP